MMCSGIAQLRASGVPTGQHASQSGTGLLAQLSLLPKELLLAATMPRARGTAVSIVYNAL
jgi:hypothetical protein